MRDENDETEFGQARNARGLGSAHVPDFPPASPHRGEVDDDAALSDDEPLPAPHASASRDRARSSASGVRLRIEDRAEESLQRFADRLGLVSKSVVALTSRLRDAGVGGDPVNVAHDLAERGQHVARSVGDIDVRGVAQRLERELDERPVRTLVIAVAAGWVVGRIVR